jgi:hypothetical protein
VLIHYPSRLRAAVAVLVAEIQCGDGVFAEWTPEHAKSIHLCDGVMPHSFKCSRLFRYDSELKSPSSHVVSEIAACAPVIGTFGREQIHHRKVSTQGACYGVLRQVFG